MNGTARASAGSSVISKLQFFQRLADGLEWFLSPVRLPVSPPGLRDAQLKNIVPNLAFPAGAGILFKESAM